MRILVVNPNTSAAVTAKIEAEARLAAGEAAEIVAVTGPFGVPFIENEPENVVAAHGVLQALAAGIEGCDAAIVAAFSEPGLDAARRLFPMPLTGIGEAAFLTACQLGRRFSVVTFGRHADRSVRERLATLGLLPRLASVRGLVATAERIGQVQEDLNEALVAAARAAFEVDGADCVILGGGALAGFARRIQAGMPGPLVDGTSAAVQQAMALVRGGYGGGLAARPGRAQPKRVDGLDPNLAGRLARA